MRRIGRRARQERRYIAATVRRNMTTPHEMARLIVLMQVGTELDELRLVSVDDVERLEAACAQERVWPT